MNLIIMKHTLVLIILLNTILLALSACHCKKKSVLSDLAIHSFKRPNTIFIGTSFDVISEIINIEEEGDCIITNIANNTINLLQVYFDDGASGFQLVGELSDIKQGEIEPGQIVSLIETITINKAGGYRLDYFVDLPNLVPERDETNNSTGRFVDQLAQIRLLNNYKSLFLEVLPLTDGTFEIQNKPIVEFN